jgi:uncharacterized SAM-binding protein YcdF (DUF218 family)
VRALRRRWLSAGWLALYAAAVLLLVAAVGVRWAGDLLVVSLPPRGPDAIVSLASHEWERLPATATLAREYPSAVVLLTLPLRVTEHNCHRCGDRQGFLIQAGVEADRIHILTADPVLNTRDEAAACLAYARRTKPREMIIVTSPYHTRRALATFRLVFDGTGVKLAIHPALDTSPARPRCWWRQPYDRAYVAYEWAAILFYGVRFGVRPWNA